MARTGRPTKLSDVIGQRAVIDPTSKQPTGQTVDVTRTEQIVGDIRIGLTAHRAAKRAGIHRQTLDAWEQEAADLRQRLATRPDDYPPLELTAKQADLLEFSDAIHRAELEWQVQCEMLLQQGSQGGGQIVETHETFKDGKLVESRTVTKTLAPDHRVTQWRLKHRLPTEYVERVQIEGTGEGGAIPLDVRADAVGDALAQWLAAKAPHTPSVDDPTGALDASESGSDDP